MRWQARAGYDQERVAELRAALEEIHRYALGVVGASEAYGETESAHLWNEIAATAESALWPLAQPESSAAKGGE